MLEHKHTIKLLPQDRTISVEHNKNLLTQLIEESIFLRSDCGGHGTCGKCKVKVIDENGVSRIEKACALNVTQDLTIEIPSSSVLSAHIIKKAPATLPHSFFDSFKKIKADPAYSIAVDLGTTTIALYLCDHNSGRILSSVSLKNPQALYGDDVMSRIDQALKSDKKFKQLNKLAIKALEWGCRKLCASQKIKNQELEKMVIVGNPTMLHLLLGISPKPLSVAPYNPAFYEAKTLNSQELGFEIINLPIKTLPQISGFIGADILATTLAAEIHNQPPNTLIIDIGTNGELVFKGEKGLYATSCAIGPAFEGATIACGMQGTFGAIEKIAIDDPKKFCSCEVISKNDRKTSPTGICGSGVISATAQLFLNKIIALGGAFNKDQTIAPLRKDKTGKWRYVLVCKGEDQKEIYISQKDIRSIQLGKAALKTGIEFLLKQEGLKKPAKIIVAGAFGSHLDKTDILTLQMIPNIAPSKIEIAGNLAGAGAVMALCDNRYSEMAKNLADNIKVIELATNPEFQKIFIENLVFEKDSQTK